MSNFSTELPYACRIKKLLTDKCLTQDQLSKLSEVPSSTISGWLKDKEPKIKGLVDVAKALGVTTAYLCGENTCEQPNDEEIHKITGLSNEAIKSLKSIEMKATSEDDHRAQRHIYLCNYLIENVEKTNLFEDLFTFLFEVYYTKDDDKKLQFATLIHSVSYNGKVRKDIGLGEAISQAHALNVLNDLLEIKKQLDTEYDPVRKENYEIWLEQERQKGFPNGFDTEVIIPAKDNSK